MFKSISKIFEKIGEVFSLIFSGLSNATFLDWVFIIIVFIIGTAIILFLLYHLILLIASIFKIEILVRKSRMKTSLLENENMFSTSNNRDYLSHQINLLRLDIKSLKKDRKDKDYLLQTQNIELISKIRNLLANLLNENSKNSRTVSLLNDKYEDFLKLYIKQTDELEKYKQGYAFTMFKHLISQIIVFLKTVNKESIFTEEMKNSINNEMENILLSVNVKTFKPGLGEKIDQRYHKVIEVQHTMNEEEINTIYDVNMRGYLIDEENSERILEPAAVKIYVRGE